MDTAMVKSIITGFVLLSLIPVLMGCSRPEQPLSTWFSRQTGQVSAEKPVDEPAIRLRIWKMGIVVESRTHKEAFMYLRFYEWNMFGAVLPAKHTRGSSDWPWQLSPDKSRATMKSPAMNLTVQAANDGADLILTITNKSGHDWPATAAIIPCFNPGVEWGGVRENPLFFDETHRNTYFVGPDGLELLQQREIHFNNALSSALYRLSPDGKFTFSDKWPSSQRNATEGLMIRQSQNKKWVAGIAWEDYLSAQGHNPWKCMHLAVRVGPLKQGESKKVRGKIYLFQGTRQDCLKRFHKDFFREK